MATSRPDEPGTERLSRRDAIHKAATGAVVAGVVWSAPRVEGLSLRPSYAAAFSGAIVSQNFVFDFDTPGTKFADAPLGTGNVRIRMRTRFVTNPDPSTPGSAFADASIVQSNGDAGASFLSACSANPPTWSFTPVCNWMASMIDSFPAPSRFDLNVQCI